MLSPSQLESFARDGFVKGSVFVDDTHVEALQRETLRVIDERETLVRRPVLISNLTGDAENPVWQIVNIWEASDAFEALLRHPTLVEEVAQIMQSQMQAREIRLFHDQIQYKPARVGGVNMWHQDSPYWPVLTPKNVQLTAWVALDDVDEDNGCMSMVRGSQAWGDQIEFVGNLKAWDAMPSEWQNHQLEIVPCPVARGQVHFHHPLTWHGSPANGSGRPRRAVALHFMTERALYKPTSGHPMRQFIEVGEGQTVQGEHFPLVWQAA